MLWSARSRLESWHFYRCGKVEHVVYLSGRMRNEVREEKAFKRVWRQPSLYVDEWTGNTFSIAKVCFHPYI
jgi:hypothetical protein